LTVWRSMNSSRYLGQRVHDRCASIVQCAEVGLKKRSFCHEKGGVTSYARSSVA
jgi:hypothetical protein